MYHKLRLGISPRRLLGVGIAIVAAFSLSIMPGLAAAPTGEGPYPIDPDSPLMQTWVLDSADQFRLDAPPDEAATAQEIAQLMAMASERDENAMNQINYWNSGAPVYRWNQIALDAMLARGVPAPAAYRHLALIHVAISDATAAAWDSKYTHNRPRPSEFDSALTTVIPNPANPSYPSEFAATAAAAAAVLSWVFPEDAQHFDEQMQLALNSRLLAGVEYPSDVDAGRELGQQVAELVIAYGEADGFTTAWTGSVPTEAGKWTGENPAFPAAATWQTWALESPDQFRPVAPPAVDSEQFAAEMAELHAFERTPVTNAKAMFWEYGAGGRHVYWYWNNEASQLILSSEVYDDALLAARAYALVNIAGHDATVACWDAKYTYWAMRPFQFDAEFKPLFTTPGHPSYPSAHSCYSMSAVGVLAHLFPSDRERLMDIVTEVGEARIWGGIHFRSDIVAGLELGQYVGAAVISQAQSDSQ